MDMPYVLLVSVIIGVTNIIPFFGPFIGAIPSTFIILIVNPVQALWFVLFILILQQIDGNIIGPKILGSSTGLPAIWVMFAILVGGGLAGFVGMIAGVPAMAVIYTLFKNYVKQRLEQKALPSNTEDYLSSGMDPYQAKGAVNHASESAGSDS
jgi:predicted PurR-regulated permease PerM